VVALSEKGENERRRRRRRRKQQERLTEPEGSNRGEKKETSLVL